jgi:hypothetical protein
MNEELAVTFGMVTRDPDISRQATFKQGRVTGKSDFIEQNYPLGILVCYLIPLHPDDDTNFKTSGNRLQAEKR